MTTSVPVTTVSALANQQTAPIGSLIYLAAYMLQLSLSAEITPPDTPNLYSGKFKIMGDAGDMSLDGLIGPRGYPGQAQFPLRLQKLPIVQSVADLPNDLTDTPTDIGKFWEINILDEEGVITDVQSWTWYGDHWRVIRMGRTGPPGPVPAITPSVLLIQPQTPPTYPDTTSYIDATGVRLEPTWEFGLAVPRGPMGPPEALYLFPDTDFTSIATNTLLAASGMYTESGLMIFKPLSMSQFATQYFSVPENAFTDYNGVSQQAPIGSFTLPPQPFPWTPIVWGHMGGGGVMLSGTPFKIGCEVLLGDPVSGIQISRGFGNTLGEVNVLPHYSTPGDKNKTLTATNQYAMVPANHTDPAQGTVYFNLWNDGQWGAYLFQHHNAQMFILVLPLENNVPLKPF